MSQHSKGDPPVPSFGEKQFAFLKQQQAVWPCSTGQQAMPRSMGSFSIAHARPYVEGLHGKALPPCLHM